MNQPGWIRLDAALAMHAESLLQHGGPEGLKDLGLLQSESALVRAQNLFVYADPPPSLHRLAAAYAKGIVSDHPFVDGNKRTAFVVSVTFLLLNGLRLTASREERTVTFWKLAGGTLSEEQLAEWFEQNTAPR